MRKRWMLLAGIVVVVLATGIVLWFVHSPQHNTSDDARNDQPKPVVTETPHKNSMPTANTRLLEQSLDSPSVQVQSKALAAELRSAFMQQGQPLLPHGVTIKLKPGTFVVNGDAAQVQAVLSNGQQYVLRLTRENNTWLLLYTKGM